MCYWKKMKVFDQVKLTLLEYSLFIFNEKRVWVIILPLNEQTAVKPDMDGVWDNRPFSHFAGK